MKVLDGPTSQDLLVSLMKSYGSPGHESPGPGPTTGKLSETGHKLRKYGTLPLTWRILMDPPGVIDEGALRGVGEYVAKGVKPPSCTDGRF